MSGNLDEPTRTALLPYEPIEYIGKPVVPMVLQRALKKAERLTELSLKVRLFLHQPHVCALRRFRLLVGGTSVGPTRRAGCVLLTPERPIGTRTIPSAAQGAGLIQMKQSQRYRQLQPASGKRHAYRTSRNTR